MLTGWYDYISKDNIFEEEHLIPARRGDKWYLIDLFTGTVINSYTYDYEPEYLAEDRIKIYTKGECQIIDRTGLCIHKGYRDIAKLDICGEIVFIVTDKNKLKGIASNLCDKIIVECEYDNIQYDNKSNCFIVTKNGKKGLIDSKGNQKIETDYEDIVVISHDLAIVTNSRDKSKLQCFYN